jgi:hypothetical protein
MTFDNGLKILTVLGAIASFLWGVYQWREKSSQELEAQKQESARLVETRRIEATKPFLERQLALYAEATKIAAQVATQGNSDSGKKALARFWELYWGELALVENRSVEAAMKRMGDALRANASTQELEQASLAVAHACRESLDRSWGIRAWSSPDEAASAARRVP